MPTAKKEKCCNNGGLTVVLYIVLLLIIAAVSYFIVTHELRLKELETDTSEYSDLDARIEAGIEQYIQKQVDEQQKAQEEANKPQKFDDVSADDDAILGDAFAPVTIVEFSDYECPFCKRHYTEVYPKLKENYIDTGKVKLIFRDFPLAFHDPIATEEAMAAECFREQKGDSGYYEFHDLLYETTNSNKGLEKSQLYDLAEQLGADKTAFTSCLDDEKYKAEVEADIAYGRSLGIQGTPGFFINGWYLKGAFPYSEFEKYIEQELAAS